MNRPPTPSPPAAAETVDVVDGAGAGRSSTRARGSRCSPGSCSPPASLVALFLVPGLPDIANDHQVRWWMLVPAFALAEMLVVHLELRNEAHTFTLVEVPLLLGLCFASPGDLILGRLLGEGLILALRVRQSPHKHAFNQALFLAETSIALIVFGLIDQGRSITSPWAWLAGIAALLAANVLGTVTVSTVIAWHGGDRNTTQLVLGGAITLATNATLALNAALLLSVSWPATTLVVAVIAVCFLAYRGSVALRQRFERLTALFEFTRLVNDTHDPEAVFEAMLVQTCELLRAEWAEITLFAGSRRRAAAAGDAHAGRPGAAVGPRRRHAGRGGRRRPQRAAASCGRPAATRDARLAEILQELDAPDAMLTPLVADGRLVGVLTVADRTSDVSTFDDDDAHAFASLADAASVALENGRLVERLDDEARQRAHDALHDALTGLPNRLALHPAARRPRSTTPDGQTGRRAGRRTSTASARSTTRSATPPATWSCSRWPAASATPSAPTPSWPASAATSSPCARP